MLDSFEAKASVEFGVTKRQDFAEISINVTGPRPVDIGTNNFMTMLAKAVSQETVTCWNVQNPLLAIRIVGQMQNGLHVVRKISNVGEISFEHLKSGLFLKAARPGA